MNIQNLINEYISSVPARMPIFTKDIFDFAKKKVPDLKKGVLNEYITRYMKKHSEFTRYKKGIYYKTVETPFGKAGIKYSELIKRFYIEDGKNIIGYETGPSYMNKLGLTTQMSACTYIATQKERATVALETGSICLLKPIIEINRENYRYLQLLDVIENKSGVVIENSNYKNILRNEIFKYSLEFEKMLGYAQYYDSNKLYKKIAELARL